jgi:hypothetical protein
VAGTRAMGQFPMTEALPPPPPAAAAAGRPEDAPTTSTTSLVSVDAAAAGAECEAAALAPEKADGTASAAEAVTLPVAGAEDAAGQAEGAAPSTTAEPGAPAAAATPAPGEVSGATAKVPPYIPLLPPALSAVYLYGLPSYVRLPDRGSRPRSQ